jgi:ribose-phosphate pyrophosphokinase
MKILSGSNSLELGRKTAELAELELVERKIFRFPDQECYLRLESEVSGEHVIIIENAYPDTGFLECLLLKDALFENGAAKVSMVIPYLGYARQDQRFKPGEPISIRAVLGALTHGVEQLVAIDLHKEHSLSFLPKGTPGINLSAVEELGRYLKGQGVDIIVAPDKGARGRATRAAAVAGCQSDYLEKTRLDGESVKIAPKDLQVKGKVVGIVDDMISTGGTIIKAADNLFELGAAKVFACCTHGLFIRNSLPMLQDHVDAVLCTDTLVSQASEISVAPVIARWLKTQVENGQKRLEL